MIIFVLLKYTTNSLECNIMSESKSVLTADDLREINDLLNNCKSLDKELKEIDRCIDFLINEYKTNKHWFKTSGSGKVTIENSEYDSIVEYNNSHFWSSYSKWYSTPYASGEKGYNSIILYGSSIKNLSKFLEGSSPILTDGFNYKV